MPKKMNSKLSHIMTALAVSICVLCVVTTGMARGDKSGSDTAKSSGKTSVQQKGRTNVAKPSGNAGVRQQGRPNVAKPSGNASVRQQGRPNTAKPSGNAGVRQQGRANVAKPSGNAGVRQHGRPNVAKPSGNASVRQQGRPNVAKPSGNASVRQQGRPNVAKPSGNASVRQQGRPNVAKPSGNASVRQQGRPNVAKPSGNASVRQQGRPNVATPSGNAGARQQGRPNTAKPSGNAGARQQGHPNIQSTGNAVLSRPGRQSLPTSKIGMQAYQRAQRGEALQGWGRRVQVDPVYVTQWHQPRYQSGSYYYGGFGYTSGFNYGYWAFGTPRYRHYNSPFFVFGLLFILGQRTVIVRQPDYVYYPVSDYSYDPNYHDSNYLRHGRYSGVNSALSDIRNSWLDNNSDPLGRHINPSARLSIYLDGRYAYSMSGKDYRGMSADAMHHTGTISFAPYKVAKRSDGAYCAYAKQQLYDADHNYKVAYVSYTLAPKNGNWMIVAVGSSDHRLN